MIGSQYASRVGHAASIKGLLDVTCNDDLVKPTYMLHIMNASVPVVNDLEGGCRRRLYKKSHYRITLSSHYRLVASSGSTLNENGKSDCSLCIIQ